MDQPFAVERGADRADAAVHHVGRRDHVDAGLGLHQRLTGQHRQRLVVGDVAVADHAVMAMVGVGIERDVADQAELGELALEQARGLAHQVVGVRRFRALRVLLPGRGRGEQGERRDAEPRRRLDVAPPAGRA